MSAQRVYALCPLMSEGMQYPGTRVMDGCELPCGLWEPDPSPLEEQQVPLTAEPLFFKCLGFFQMTCLLV